MLIAVTSTLTEDDTYTPAYLISPHRNGAADVSTCTIHLYYFYVLLNAFKVDDWLDGQLWHLYVQL